MKMKIIYQPTGPAGEYSPWAANFYLGCTHNCEYCYNNKGLTSATLGGTNVRLKKSLVDEATAYDIFCKELDKYKNEIIKDGGLHFNFVSDPCLPQTIDLNWKCIAYALSQGVPVQVLTKRADWLDHPAVQDALSNPDLLKVGLTLTGCDDIEPGASPNLDRIKAMQMLHDAGVFTWASCEPIIEPKRTLEMIQKSLDCCDHYKIGILSGKKSYSPQDIRDFVTAVKALNPKDVAWKNSLLEYIKKP
jgi:DNA repair photolyase